MREDLEAEIEGWQRDLYATRYYDPDRDPSISDFSPTIVPDNPKRDTARIKLKFVITANPEYRQMAQQAFNDGMAKREEVDSRIEGTDFKIGCLGLYGGVFIGVPLAVLGAIELIKYCYP